jgi:excisionase family DNA binding protein
MWPSKSARIYMEFCMLKQSSNSLPKLSYGVAEAVQATGVGRSTLYAAMAAGKLRAIKLGSRTIILADELRRFLGELPSANAREDRSAG